MLMRMKREDPEGLRSVHEIMTVRNGAERNTLHRQKALDFIFKKRVGHHQSKGLENAWELMDTDEFQAALRFRKNKTRKQAKEIAEAALHDPNIWHGKRDDGAPLLAFRSATRVFDTDQITTSCEIVSGGEVLTQAQALAAFRSENLSTCAGSEISVQLKAALLKSSPDKQPCASQAHVRRRLLRKSSDPDGIFSASAPPPLAVGNGDDTGDDDEAQSKNEVPSGAHKKGPVSGRRKLLRRRKRKSLAPCCEDVGDDEDQDEDDAEDDAPTTKKSKGEKQDGELDSCQLTKFPAFGGMTPAEFMAAKRTLKKEVARALGSFQAREQHIGNATKAQR